MTKRNRGKGLEKKGRVRTTASHKRVKREIKTSLTSSQKKALVI